MAGLISEAKSSDGVFGIQSSPHFCKSEPTERSAGASPLCHNAKAKKSGETPIATRFMETKFKGGFAETVDLDSQTHKTLKTAGATRKKQPERN